MLADIKASLHDGTVIELKKHAKLRKSERKLIVKEKTNCQFKRKNLNIPLMEENIRQKKVLECSRR